MTNPIDDSADFFPSTYQQPYQGLKLALETMQASMVTNQATGAELKQGVAALQEQFKRGICTLDTSQLNPTVEHQVQSLNVEIDKQLRLLNMDVMFFQAARQATTIAQRQSQIRDRLTTLIQYCSAVLSKP